MIYLTPTQKRLMEVLGDEKPHTREELFGQIDDELSDESNLRTHISFLRDKLRQQGKTVHSINSEGKRYYQLGRFIDTSE